MRLFIISILAVFSIIGIYHSYDFNSQAENSDPVITIEGYFNIGEKIFKDKSFEYEYYLFVDNGTEQIPYFLKFENPPDSLFELSGNIVQVTGHINQESQYSKYISNANVIDTESIVLKDPIKSTAKKDNLRTVPSPLKSVTILAKYASNTAEPHSKSYFEDRFYNAADSLAAYWTDTSYGALTLTGQVVDWVQLPTTKIGYGDGGGTGESVRRLDVINAAGIAIDYNGDDNTIQNTGQQIESGNNDDVDLVIMIYNDQFNDGNYAFAFLDAVKITTYQGSLYVYLIHSPDIGNDFPVGIVFENGVGTIAHEMGHNFEWEHTPPPTGDDTYGDEWSLMSGGGADGPPGTISFNKDLAGWIPSEDKKTVLVGQESTFTLDILSDPSPGSNYLMGIVPFGSAGHYYTVEARKDSTFDQTPQNQMGLMIYHYSPTGHPSSPEPDVPVNQVDTKVKGNFDDSDLNQDNTTYFDSTNNITIKYLSKTDTTITVLVSNNNINKTPVAKAGSDQSVYEGTLVTLDASASSDANGDTLTYSWTQTGGDSVTLSDTTAVMPTFTAPSVDGTTILTFSLTVSDGTNTSTADTVSITVKDLKLFVISENGTATIKEDGIPVEKELSLKVTGTYQCDTAKNPSMQIDSKTLNGTITVSNEDTALSLISVKTGKNAAKTISVNAKTGPTITEKIASTLNLAKVIDCNTPLNVAALTGKNTFSAKIGTVKYNVAKATTTGTLTFGNATNSLAPINGTFTLVQNGTAKLTKPIQTFGKGNYLTRVEITGNSIISQAEGLKISNLNGTLNINGTEYALIIQKFVVSTDFKTITYNTKLNGTAGSVSGILKFPSAVNFVELEDQDAINNKNTLKSKVSKALFDTKKTSTGKIDFD